MSFAMGILAILLLALPLIVWGVYRYFPSPSFGGAIDLAPQETQSVCLLMVGDVGSGLQSQRDVASLLNELSRLHKPNALIFAGDNFINHGVEDVHDKLWKERFHDVYNLPHLSKLPVVAILGNHDYAGNAQAQIEYSKIFPKRWIMPGRHFLVRFGSMLELGCVDTNFPDWSGLGFMPLDKLQRHLRNSKASWRVVVGHRPLYSGGIYTSIQWHLRFILERFLVNSRASVYVSGHDHCQQHIPFVPMFSSQMVHQVVAGCGGSALREVELNHPNSQYSANAHGAVCVKVSPTRLDVSFHSVGSLEAKHSFSIVKTV